MGGGDHQGGGVGGGGRVGGGGGEKFLKNLNVFFMTKNLQLVYPP